MLSPAAISRRAATKRWQADPKNAVKIATYRRRTRIRAARARRLAELTRLRTAAKLILTVVNNVIAAHSQGRPKKGSR